MSKQTFKRNKKQTAKFLKNKNQLSMELRYFQDWKVLYNLNV